MEDKKVKRFVNFRPLFILFIAMCCGVFACVNLFLNNILPAILIGIVLLFSAVFYVVSAIKKDFGKNFAKHFGTDFLWKICLVIFVGIVVGAGLSAINFSVKIQREFQNGKQHISSRVKEISASEDETIILLDKIAVNGSEKHFKIKAYISSQTTDIEIGSLIEFDGYLYQNKLVTNGKISTTPLVDNVQYNCYVDIATLQINGKNANVLDLFKNKIKMIFFDNMSQYNASFAYASICGDKALMSETYSEIFRKSGLSHILAVSGFNVVFLVSAIYFILKIFKTNKKFTFCFTTAVLVVYCILCQFSPSVFRAMVMTVCLMLGMVLGKRSDNLSNLSLAGIIVLTVQPLNLFDVGFLLSFGAVFGIFLLNKPFDKICERFNLYKNLYVKFVLQLVWVSLSAMLGTVPFVFTYFGEMAFLALLSNLLILPLVNLMYVILVFSLILNLIFPLSLLIKFTEFFVNVIVSCSAVFSQFEMIKTFAFNIFSGISYFVILFLISPFLMLEPKRKLIVSFALVVALSCVVANENLERKFDHFSASAVSGVSNTIFLTTNNNQKILVDCGKDENDEDEIKFLLKSNKAFSLDYILLFNFSDSKQKVVCKIAKDYKAKNIVVFGKTSESTKLGLYSNLSKTDGLQFLDGINYSFENSSFEVSVLYDGDVLMAESIVTKDASILKIEYALTPEFVEKHKLEFLTYDFAFARKYKPLYETLSIKKFLAFRLCEATTKVDCIANYDLWTNA